MPKNVKNIILYGSKGQKLKISRNTSYGNGSYEAVFEGIINNLERRYKESTSEWAKEDIAAYMNEVTCPHCNGERLKKTVLGVTVGGKNISQFTRMSIIQAVNFINNIKLTDRELNI